MSSFPPPPILHPLSILSMIVLGLNDHIWKAAYANMWTGKISDISGLIFFPLLLEYILPSRRGSVLCTGMVFTLLNTNEVFNQLWKDTFQLIYDSIGRECLAHSTMDITDLYALIALSIPLYIIPKKES